MVRSPLARRSPRRRAAERGRLHPAVLRPDDRREGRSVPDRRARRGARRIEEGRARRPGARAEPERPRRGVGAVGGAADRRRCRSAAPGRSSGSSRSRRRWRPTVCGPGLSSEVEDDVHRRLDGFATIYERQLEAAVQEVWDVHVKEITGRFGEDWPLLRRVRRAGRRPRDPRRLRGRQEGVRCRHRAVVRQPSGRPRRPDDDDDGCARRTSAPRRWRRSRRCARRLDREAIELTEEPVRRTPRRHQGAARHPPAGVRGHPRDGDRPAEGHAAPPAHPHRGILGPSRATRSSRRSWSRCT